MLPPPTSVLMEKDKKSDRRGAYESFYQNKCCVETGGGPSYRSCLMYTIWRCWWWRQQRKATFLNWGLDSRFHLLQLVSLCKDLFSSVFWPNIISYLCCWPSTFSHSCWSQPCSPFLYLLLSLLVPSYYVYPVLSYLIRLIQINSSPICLSSCCLDLACTPYFLRLAFLTRSPLSSLIRPFLLLLSFILSCFPSLDSASSLPSFSPSRLHPGGVYLLDETLPHPH